MALRPEEVTTILEQALKDYDREVHMTGVGTVLQVGDGTARIYGLEDVMASELVEFPNGVFGIAFSLEEDNVGTILLGSDRGIQEGDTVKTTRRIVEVPVGEALLGRVVNAIGQPVDGKGPIVTDKTRPVEKKAPGVVYRRPVSQPLQTGLKAIDSMIPIGRGQRELIIGDRQTGKTALAVDTIINQRDAEPPAHCVYVAIGQKMSTVAQVVATLEKHDAMRYTTVVVATASDAGAMLFLAPYAGCAMGEEFRDTGRHALVVYDDLTKHAQAYREVSLLLRRPPGREAFPGDIFNLHSRLLERAAKLAGEYGGGSLTALPIIETQAGDYSGYIPTNVISITDGQIYLEPELFFAGVRPAVNVGISVSRVGGKAQIPAMRKVQGNLRVDLAQYREVAAYAQFASDLDKTVRDQLHRGERMVELLKQEQYVPMPVEDQVIIIYAGSGGFLDDLALDQIAAFEKQVLPFVHERYPEILNKIRTTKDFAEETEQLLRKALTEFKATFAKPVPQAA